jgi:hypothetical protein
MGFLSEPKEIGLPKKNRLGQGLTIKVAGESDSAGQDCNSSYSTVTLICQIKFVAFNPGSLTRRHSGKSRITSPICAFPSHPHKPMD